HCPYHGVTAWSLPSCRYCSMPFSRAFPGGVARTRNRVFPVSMLVAWSAAPDPGSGLLSLRHHPHQVVLHECPSHVAPGARQLLTRWFGFGWDGDAVPDGVVVEVVEGGEGVRGGIDGVAGLGEGAADVAEVA